jgi:hypothetical protein
MEKQFSKFIDKKDFFFQLGQKDGQDGKYRSREEISMLPDVGKISEDQFQEYLSGYQVGEEDSYHELNEANLLNFLNEEEQLDEKSSKSAKRKRRKKRKKKKAKKDACYHKVRARYDVWPSAYASGALVKCRKVGAANWGNSSKKKNEGLELDEHLLQVIQEEYRAVLDEKKKKRKKRKKKKAGTESGKEKSLRDWFGRKGGKGSSSGWVDCNTCRKDKKTGRKKCKSCGRKKGEKRSKYPSCRPTPGACGERGRGKSWGKKSAKGKK